MQNKIGDSFKTDKAKSYKDHSKGFYVYAKDSDLSPEKMADYVGCYLSRPVIANFRIDRYDGLYVTFHYNRHEDEMIRYYGLYADSKKQKHDLHKRYPVLSGPEPAAKLYQFYAWRSLMLSCFNTDPIECPVCKKTMTLMLVKFNKGKETLKQHYNRIMGHPPEP